MFRTKTINKVQQQTPCQAGVDRDAGELEAEINKV